MIRKFTLGFATLGLVAAPANAFAASYGFNLFASVAVRCSVSHQATGFGTQVGEAVSLGTFREYCNAPEGYEVTLNYTPGTLRGARIIAGTEQVVLDGSGHALLSRAAGPRILERSISAVPGENGFDSDTLDLRIDPV